MFGCTTNNNYYRLEHLPMNLFSSGKWSSGFNSRSKINSITRWRSNSCWCINLQWIIVLEYLDILNQYKQGKNHKILLCWHVLFFFLSNQGLKGIRLLEMVKSKLDNNIAFISFLLFHFSSHCGSISEKQRRGHQSTNNWQIL